jgi:hypothetical protein
MRPSIVFRIEGAARMASPKRRTKKKMTSHSGRKWSGRVTRKSNALELKKGVFSLRDPEKIAASLKRSAERSKRRKTTPYRSRFRCSPSISTAQEQSFPLAAATFSNAQKSNFGGCSARTAITPHKKRRHAVLHGMSLDFLHGLNRCGHGERSVSR